MNSQNNNLIYFILACCGIAVILNLIIPEIILPYISDDVKNPENGVESLSFSERFLHLMYSFTVSPFLSSLILIIIVAVSTSLASVIKIRPSTIKSLRN